MQNKKILLIDDSKVSLKYLETILQKHGAITTAVSFPRVGLELAGTQEFDCIITDYEMPELTGIEVCESIRRVGKNRYTPLLVFTSNEEKKFIVNSIEKGADNFIKKNESAEIVCLKINAALRLKELNNNLIALSRTDSIRKMIVTYNHEFNSLLTILEMDVKGHLKKYHKDDPTCMNDLIDITKKLKELVERVNSFDEYKEKKYIDEVGMVDLDKK